MTRPDLERGFPPSKLVLLFPENPDKPLTHVSVLGDRAEEMGLTRLSWDPSPDPEDPSLRLPYVRAQWAPSLEQVRQAIQARATDVEPLTIDREPVLTRDGRAVCRRKALWAVLRKLRRQGYAASEPDDLTGLDLWWELTPLGVEYAEQQRAYAASRAARLAP